MKIIDNAITFIVSLDKRKFILYLGIIAFSLLVISGAITYFIHVQGKHLISRIQTSQKIRKEARETTFLYEKIQEKKQNVINAIEKEKDFELKSFFASFCKENNIKAESSWSTISTLITGNEFLEEISLLVTFNNFTMQKCVALLEELEKNDIVYIKELMITKEGENKRASKTISLQLTLATLKYRQKEGE